MRRRKLLMCVGWLTAIVAVPGLCVGSAAAQTNQTGAPVAAQFVGTPGQSISAPGRVVTMPGQAVTMPGREVTPAPMAIAPIGPTISPTPGVITPFYRANQQNSSSAASPAMQSGDQPGVTPGRNYQNRYQYEPEYGTAGSFGVPYGANAAGAARPESFGTDARRQMYANAPSGNRPPYRPDARSRRPKRESAASSVIPAEPVLMLVMKNGSRQQVRNYALTPQTLIDLDGAASGKTKEIPLSQINVAATKKAAAQAGMSFAVPTSGE